MIPIRLLWHDYRYLPYELELAHREIKTFFEQESEIVDGGLTVTITKEQIHRIEQLTYFKGAELPFDLILPDQSRFEASSLTNGLWCSSKQPMPSLRRQSTRYSAHGLHEYRGKFNPQMVRAIGNLIGMEHGAWVLDPFCGSGTTLLEAAHMGWNALGFDVNPLGVVIANAKVTAFKSSPQTLQHQAKQLISRLEGASMKEGVEWQSYLPSSEYLASWFAVEVLEQLTVVLKEIEKIDVENLRPFFRVVLSDICREVSLQDPDDLRIRRRKEPYPNFTPIQDFCTTLLTKVETICRAREQVNPQESHQLALYGDSRFANEQAINFLEKQGHCLVDAAITSPPYATALPYVDTQRLSLCLLGLIPSSAIRATERDLIGNREISDKERTSAEKELLDNEAGLPTEVIVFCRKLLEAANHDSHGFRRRNVPALVYKYFAQMAQTFVAVGNLVRQRGYYALVVGGNKTSLQGEEISIDTPALLACVAEARGWVIADEIKLDTYQRFDVHKKNSVRTETLLLLQNTKPS